MIYTYLFFISLITLLFYYYNKDKRVLIIIVIPFILLLIKKHINSGENKKLEHFEMDKLNLQITKDDLFIIPVKNLIPINCCSEEEDAKILKLDPSKHTCFSSDKCISNNIHRYYWHLFLNCFTVVSKKKIDKYNSFAKYNNMELWHLGTFKTENEAQLYVSSIFNPKLPHESSYQYSGILGLDKDFVRIVKVSDIIPDCLCINENDFQSINQQKTKIDSDITNFFNNRQKLVSDSIDGDWAAPGPEVFAVGPNYNYTKEQAKQVCSKYNAEVATTAQLEKAQKQGADWCFTAWVSDSNNAKYPITTSTGGGCGNGRSGVISWTPGYNTAGVNCYGPKPGINDYPNTILPFNQTVWSQKSGSFVSNELCLKYNIYSNYWTQNIKNYALVSLKQFDNYYNFGKYKLKPIWHIKTFKNELDAQYYFNKLFNLNKEPDSIKVGDATFTIIPVNELIPANCCLNTQGMIALNELNPKLGYKSGCVQSWGGNTPEALKHCIDNNIYINYWSDNALGYAIVSDKKYKDYRNFATYKNIPVWHLETYPEFSKAMVGLKTKYNRKILNEKSKSYVWQYLENSGKTLFNLDKDTGDIQCLSNDGKNCLWGFVDAANDNPTYSKRDPIVPLKCGEQHSIHWGGIGYNDKNHWCSKAFNQLMKNSQESYDYNDWSIYKTQYINNKKIEPTSVISRNTQTTSILNKKWIGPIANSCCVKNITQLKDGTILGIGMDNKIWTKTKLTDVWLQSPIDTCCVTSVTQLNDGTILGIGMNNMIWKKNSLSEYWSGPIQNSCCVINITQLKDGTILGIGMDNKIWTKKNINDNWKGPIKDSCCIISIIQLNDETLLGVGTDSLIYTKKNLNDKWQGPISNSCCVKNITQLIDGNLICVGLDNQLWSKNDILSPEIIKNDKNDLNSKITRVNMSKNFAISLIVNLNGIEARTWTEVLSITGIKDELPLNDGIVNSRILSLVITPNTNLLTVIIGDNKNYTTTAMDIYNKFELPINTEILIDIVFSKNKFKIYKNNILFSVAPLSLDRTYPNEAFIYSSYVIPPMKGYFRNLVFISSDGPLTVHDLTLNGVFIDDKNSLIYLFCNNILLIYKFKTVNLEFNDKFKETKFTITNKRKIEIEDKTLVGFEYINPNTISIGDIFLYRYYPKETIVINNDSNKTLLRFNNSIYGDIPNQNKLAITNNNFTIEFWYIQFGTEWNNTIIDKGDYEYLVSINPNNQRAIGFYNRNMGWWYVYFNVPINTWIHISLTYIKSDSILSCLINGTEINNIKLGVANLYSGIGNVNIGRQSPISCACNLLKNAMIYDLRIWNITRNQIEIANNMLSIQKINSNGLIANFLMDDKNNILIDRVNGYNANIINYVGVSNYSTIAWFPKKTDELVDYNITIFSDGIVSLTNIRDNKPIMIDMKLWSVDINSQKKCKKYLKGPVIPVIKLTNNEILNIAQDSNIKLNNIIVNFEKQYNKLLLPKLTNEEIIIIKSSLSKFKFNKIDNTNFLSGKNIKNGQSGNDYKYLGKSKSYIDCENIALKDNDINRITSISWYNNANGEISNNCFASFNNNSRVNQLGVISGIKDVEKQNITNEPIEFLINNSLFNININNPQSVLFVSSPLFNIFGGVSKLEIIANLNIVNNPSSVAIRLLNINNSLISRTESILIKSGVNKWIINCFNLEAGSYYIDFITTNLEPFYFYNYETNLKLIGCEIKQYREYNNLLNLLQQQGIIDIKLDKNQQLESNLNDADKKYVLSVLKNIIDNHKEQIIIEFNNIQKLEDLSLTTQQNKLDIKQRDTILQNIEDLRRLNNPIKANDIVKLQNLLNVILNSIDKNTKKIEELSNYINNDKTKIEKTEQLTIINNKIMINIQDMLKKNPELKILKSIVNDIVNVNNIFEKNIALNLDIIKQSKIPESKITKISGKFTSNGIEKIEIIDANNPPVFSGTNDNGTDFSYECPDNSYIIGYDYGINKNNPGSSIFSGLGPIYCSDGTIIKKKVGKESDTKLGKTVDNIYNKFDYQSNMIRTDANMGVFDNVSSENCATICSIVDKCESFSFNENKCTIYNNNNINNLKKGGKTYNKFK